MTGDSRLRFKHDPGQLPRLHRNRPENLLAFDLGAEHVGSDRYVADREVLAVERMRVGLVTVCLGVRKRGFRRIPLDDAVHYSVWLE